MLQPDARVQPRIHVLDHCVHSDRLRPLPRRQGPLALGRLLEVLPVRRFAEGALTFDAPAVRARLQASDARKKLGQYLDALEAGMDPVLIAERTRLAEGELTSATAVIDAFSSSDSGELSGPLVHEVLEGVGGLTAVLATSDTAERQHVYRAAGVHLRYHRSEEGEKVTASLRVGLFGVGGPTFHAPSLWKIPGQTSVGQHDQFGADCLLFEARAIQPILANAPVASGGRQSGARERR